MGTTEKGKRIVKINKEFRFKDYRELGYYCDSNCCPKFATFVWNEWDECPSPRWRKQKTLGICRNCGQWACRCQ